MYSLLTSPPPTPLLVPAHPDCGDDVHHIFQRAEEGREVSAAARGAGGTGQVSTNSAGRLLCSGYQSEARTVLVGCSVLGTSLRLRTVLVGCFVLSTSLRLEQCW